MSSYENLYEDKKKKQNKCTSLRNSSRIASSLIFWRAFIKFIVSTTRGNVAGRQTSARKMKWKINHDDLFYLSRMTAFACVAAFFTVQMVLIKENDCFTYVIIVTMTNDFLSFLPWCREHWFCIYFFVIIHSRNFFLCNKKFKLQSWHFNVSDTRIYKKVKITYRLTHIFYTHE